MSSNFTKALSLLSIEALISSTSSVTQHSVFFFKADFRFFVCFWSIWFWTGDISFSLLSMLVKSGPYNTVTSVSLFQLMDSGLDLEFCKP
ncbi:hypothetical protein RM700_313 [Saccharomyces cerevisiae synthetic construct]|uniref:Putative uncharacterized protein YKR075W-A n=1 Tax=Saccharomyces cerevisiae (strain ATCC 204508 / S288c) TaxID=559292 RepID=YK075_YEAST|nr:RecName: Full=Putative uncharacterized protein YKR075W-A [Saccharomyces cerevisiae S288C]AAL79274.1 unknown [Saccharomyces cerevisiae]KZV10016.1 hypothetical protein WN66_04078 [Saccharomyces cerevisiae]WNV94395.1 hypothetical protein RM700_313 [Saccharomyces cerevisiae synthetic construct]